MRKWLNISGKESDYSADTDADSDCDADSDTQGPSISTFLFSVFLKEKTELSCFVLCVLNCDKSDDGFFFQCELGF